MVVLQAVTEAQKAGGGRWWMAGETGSKGKYMLVVLASSILSVILCIIFGCWNASQAQ